MTNATVVTTSVVSGNATLPTNPGAGAPRLTVGIDLGDRHSHLCVLDGDGAILEESRLQTTLAILGVHAIKDTPVIRDGQVVVGKKMYLSVSIDHRLVDGATGARWMNVVKEHLEQPFRLLLT